MADKVKGVEIDPVREKLVELMFVGQVLADAECDKQAECNKCPYNAPNACRVGFIADHLIANGVTFEKQVDLSGKCGSCTYAKQVSEVFGNAKCYVRCTNEEHLKTHCKRVSSELRQRTHKACKSYVPLPEPPKGE